MKIFYSDLATWWPLISPVEDYEDEARELLRIIEARSPSVRSALELGSGGGHLAHHLKHRLALTLTDLSTEMLAVSQQLNPECEHLQGDMRTLDLGRRFDLVLAHDAVDYMTTEAELAAAIGTANRHLNDGGLAVFLPDHVQENFAPDTECGGVDGTDGRAIRYLEWTCEAAPDATTGTVHYSFIVREADGRVQYLHEDHTFGLFSIATWAAVFKQQGFAVEIVEEQTENPRQPRLIFVGRKSGDR